MALTACQPSPPLLLLLLLLLLLSTSMPPYPDTPGVAAQVIGFYALSCPRAESIVTDAVTAAVKRDRTIAASLVRLMFHDCFVQGCDGSILLDQAAGMPPVEKTAVPNQTVRGFEVIDEAKAAVEAVCPGVVSCADIVSLAARDAVVLSGGPTWQVPTGRRDSRISSALAATLSLPLPSFTTPVLTQMFLAHGLSQDEMITLSGAHTIGSAHCSSFSPRLAINDPTMDPSYAAELRRVCGSNPGASVPLDPSTPFTFDSMYFTNLAANRGLLTSDQDLHTNALSQFGSNLDSSNQILWESKFTAAMFHLSSLNVLFGPAVGEIRRHCRATN